MVYISNITRRRILMKRFVSLLLALLTLFALVSCENEHEDTQSVNKEESTVEVEIFDEPVVITVFFYIFRIDEFFLEAYFACAGYNYRFIEYLHFHCRFLLVY